MTVKSSTADRDIQIREPERGKWLMEIRHEGKRLVALDWSGGAEFGESYTPEAAVRVFWESMAGPGALDILRGICEAHGYELVKK